MALIPIPSNWPNPRFEFGDRVLFECREAQVSFPAVVVGMRYYPIEAGCRPQGWEYDILAENGTIVEPTAEEWLTLLA